MSKSTPISPSTARTEVPYFFQNTFNQLPKHSSPASHPSPLVGEPSSTPVGLSTTSTTDNFADSDGEADLTDEDSDNPDLSPHEKLSYGSFNKNTAAYGKEKENALCYLPLTPIKNRSKYQAEEVIVTKPCQKRLWHSGFTPSKEAPEPKMAVDMTATVVERGMWDIKRLMKIIMGPKPKMKDLIAGEGCAWKGVVKNGGHVVEEREEGE